MVDPLSHGCLEPEVMAAYVDHRLSLAERARVETHLASCPECLALLAGVVRTVAEVSVLEPDAGVAAGATPSYARRRTIGAWTAAAAVIVVLVGATLVRPWLQRDTGLVSLADAVGKPRSVLGRLTGGFPHTPLGVPSAGGQDGRAAETDRVVLTAGRIRESFGDLRTPSRLHALGISQLLAGQLDNAAQSLLAASREQPANAQYLNDAAAVQLERARLGLRPDDLPRALAAADRARRLDPSLSEAWFNRALAATALSLKDQARTSWTEYLKRDGTSPWAAEARTRLEELARPTPAEAWGSIEGRLQQTIDVALAEEAVRAQTTEARQFLENVLLVEWANAVLAGRSGSAELERARVMAEAMQRVAGDALYKDAVAAIDRSDASALARAHLLYAEAAALVAEDRPAAALPKLGEAREALAASKSPYEWRVALDQGAAAYFTANYGQASGLLGQIASKSAQSGYAFLSGRATWQQGLIAFQQGRLDAARAHYEDTLATFDRMGDIEQRAAAHSLLAALHFALGDKAEEWRHRSAALEGLQFSRSPRFKYSVLASAAASVRFESPDTALVMQERVLATAIEWGRDAAVADVLAQRSSTLLALGRTREAADTLTEARNRLQQVSDPAIRRIFELPILAAESDLLLQTNPQLAVAAAERAIETVNARGDRSRLPQFQLRLARANIVWGRLGEAERALNEGIQAFDQQRARLTDEHGLAANDESWQLFDTALRLAIRRGDYERAFAMAERARATSLVEQRRQAAIPSLAEAQRIVRPDEAIVVLNQFDDELAIWVLRNQSRVIVSKPLQRADAARLIARQQEEIRLEVDRPVAGAQLFDTIVRPLAAQLSGVSRVTFIPDETYQDVSFAALWDRSTSQYLVEAVKLSTAPSVTTLWASASAVGGRQSERALIMASRAGEISRVADHYRNAQVVTGPSATPARFRSELPQSAVVHLSVPTQPNHAFPLLSSVTLNDEPGRRYSGTILGRDIAGQSMTATRLVVLDEIQTPQSYRTAGTFALARAFLAAGVPAVLGTLPGADESATRELIVGFHREMAGQASAEDALTRIQRNVLRSNGRRLGAWSALVIYGSDR